MLQGGWRPENALLDRGIEPAFKAAPQAKETNVYLQYIVDHYDRLPRSIAFIHAHRCACHSSACVASCSVGTSCRSLATRSHSPNAAWKLGPPKPAVVAAVIAADLLLHLMCCMCCRVSWHLGDVVDVLRELRWGEVDFGNLRYRNYSQW